MIAAIQGIQPFNEPFCMQIVSPQIMPYFRVQEVRGRIIRLHAFFFLRYCHLSLLLPSKILVFHCLTKMPKENGTCKFKGCANILETIYYIYIEGP